MKLADLWCLEAPFYDASPDADLQVFTEAEIDAAVDAANEAGAPDELGFACRQWRKARLDVALLAWSTRLEQSAMSDL